MKVSVEIRQNNQPTPRVVFQFEEINPRVHITETPKDPNAAVAQFRRRVVYEEPKDTQLEQLSGELTKTAGIIIKHNFADGIDDIETPQDLALSLITLKSLTTTMYQKRGQKDAFAAFGKAKQRAFENQTIRDLSPEKQYKLTEILRWHMEDAINNPPPQSRPSPARK